METELAFETTNSITADMVEGLLKSNDIAFERRTFGAGVHMSMIFGRSDNAGIRIFVSKDDAGKAREILAGAGYCEPEQQQS